jgi:hypothetical protein
MSVQAYKTDISDKAIKALVQEWGDSEVGSHPLVLSSSSRLWSIAMCRQWSVPTSSPHSCTKALAASSHMLVQAYRTDISDEAVNALVQEWGAQVGSIHLVFSASSFVAMCTRCPVSSI